MPLIRSFKRYMIRRRAFPDSWSGVLERGMPHYRYLPESLKDGLKRHLPVFAEEKIFEGCGGLRMDDEKKIVISAYATLLILAEPAGYYPDLRAILVYPRDYYAPVDEEDESGIVTQGMEPRAGESWGVGSLVLSWNDIVNDLSDPFNGRNLILHECSHQLDSRFGVTAGIDESGEVFTSNEWNDTLAREYRLLRSGVERGKRTLLDPYGATHPAEFFAVATESFFTIAHPMREKHGELYRMLQAFYDMDPASWLPRP